MAWTWQADKHRYVNGDRVLSERDMLDVRNAIADGMTGESATLAKQLLDGIITLAEWAKAFARLIANGITAAFLFGRGGKAQLDNKAIATIDALIGEQHTYAQSFTTDLATSLMQGTATADGVAARSALYSGGAVEAFDHGRAQDFGVDLPYFPADGLTECGGNCRCEWAIQDFNDRVEAVWTTVGDFKTCDDCIARGNEYSASSPFVQQIDGSRV